MLGPASSPSALAASSLSLADILRSQAIVRPNAPALIWSNTILTYKELDDLSERIAAGLHAANIRPGARLAVLSKNSLELALLFHAAAKAGVALAPMNWRCSAAELRDAIALTKPASIAVSKTFLNVLGEAVGTDPIPVIALDYTPKQGDGPHFGSLKNTEPAALPPVDPEHIVSIVFTSGTTGRPKAVGISHRALLARAAVIAIDWGLNCDDAYIGWAPLFHISSSDYLFTTCVLGGTYVVMDGFVGDKIVDLVNQRRIGWLFLVPGTINEFLDACERRKIRAGQVRLVGVMADLIAPESLDRVIEVVQAPYLNSFGTTETGLLPCVPSLLAVADKTRTLAKTQSALCSIRLVDEAGIDVPPGEAGEMLIRSQTMFSGYLNNEEATAAAFQGGWYHSGDVLKRNADGTLSFVGRLSGLIKSGGENIYPAEIERALLQNPEVTEAAAIGVPDPRWGEVPYAFVALVEGSQLTGDDLKSFLGDRIGSYKIPRKIVVINLEEFPRNVTGKIIRQELALRVKQSIR